MNAIIILGVGVLIGLIAIAIILIQLNSIHRSISLIHESNLMRDQLLKQLLSNQQSQEELNQILMMAVSDLQDRIKEGDKSAFFSQKMGEA
jgi:hypothetical protein